MNAPHPPQLAEIDPRFAAAHYMDGRDLFQPVTPPVSPATAAALAFAAGIAAACVLGEVVR